jgi:hypothetical protein
MDCREKCLARSDREETRRTKRVFSFSGRRRRRVCRKSPNATTLFAMKFVRLGSGVRESRRLVVFRPSIRMAGVLGGDFPSQPCAGRPVARSNGKQINNDVASPALKFWLLSKISASQHSRSIQRAVPCPKI